VRALLAWNDDRWIKTVGREANGCDREAWRSLHIKVT